MLPPSRSISFLSAVFLLVLSQPVRGETLATGGTGWSIGILHLLGEAYTSAAGIDVAVSPSLGSGGGIKAVLAGAFDVSFSARPLTIEEAAKGATAQPLCRTPFIFSVSNGMVDDIGLSKADIVGIYARRITQWPDGTQIGLVLRPSSDTVSTTLMEHFKGIEPVLELARASRGAVIAHTDQEAMDIGEKNTGSLVPTTLVAIRSEGRSLHPLKIDGTDPTPEALANGAYPMVITLRSVVGNQPTRRALDFIDFIESPTGRSILRENDCIPIDL